VNHRTEATEITKEYVEFRCPECSWWARSYHNGEFKYLDIGNVHILHHGATVEGMEIGGTNITQT
jgi:hypothetical protein